MIKILSAIMLLFVFACTCPKQETQNINTAKNTANEIYRFQVSFFSIGSGIDAKGKIQYQNFIEEYKEKNSTSINYEISTWGKEGESNFNFLLDTLSEMEQMEFIKESKEFLKQFKNIRFSENVKIPKE